MITSPKGRVFIQGYEKCRLTAYQDSHVPPIWTIGWGHTGPDVHDGLVWTQQCADLTFAEYDLNYAEHTVTTLVLTPLTQNQFDALVSLVYNIGATAFRLSTLLRLLNTHDYVGASKEFLQWDHSGGVVSSGLLNRRKAEMQIFDAEATLAVLNPTTAPPPVVELAAPPNPFSMWQSLLNLFKLVAALLGKKGS